ncbi:MAG: hypothetical protein WBC78_25010 [Candidatus Sulfotelmatobacter sp.]
MSNVATALSSFPERVPVFLRPLKAGFVGLLWVLVNISLIWLATKTQHAGICSIAAGGVDGSVLSIIAVTKISERLRSAATGLLGGISLSGLRKDVSSLTYWVHSVHGFVDNALTGLNLPLEEKLHEQIECAVIWILWVTVLVVLASLVAEWVSASWQKAE